VSAASRSALFIAPAPPVAPSSHTAENGVRCIMRPRILIIAIGLLLGWGVSGCAQVQVLRLTSETFPPREVQDVAILSQFPSDRHEKIAELSETSSSENLSKLQRHLLDKAAELGADAVVFSTPITRTEQRMAYESVYSPMGPLCALLWPRSLRLRGAVGLSI